MNPIPGYPITVATADVRIKKIEYMWRDDGINSFRNPTYDFKL